MPSRLPSLVDPPIGFAHRGARAHAPENTIEAFALALRLGATGLESDVWLTNDGVPVLDHDGLVRRGLRRVPIAEIDRADLPAHIPSLAEMIAACPGEWQFSLDIKDPPAGAAVIETVRDIRPDLLPRLWLCHWDWRVVAELRSLDPTVVLVDSTKLSRMKEGPERRAATLAERGVDAVNMHHSDWSGGLTSLFHRFERKTLAWDLQHDYLMLPVLRMGIDGVFSDWVDRMTDALATLATEPR